MQKRVLGLLITILLVVASIQFISSAPSCDIVERSECGVGKYIVMGVSDLTNAHGEFPDSGIGGYPFVLCCDFQKKRGATCVDEDSDGTPENKIIGLSSSTNAHAEEPYPTGGITYTNPVCYDDLVCISTGGSCPTSYPLSVLSLSNLTNAHIGETGEYPNYQICCGGSVVNYLTCQLTDAYWKYDEVLEGVDVELIVKGTDCDGATIMFELYKKRTFLPGWDKIDGSPGDADFDGNTATKDWNAEEPGEFYFKATVKYTDKDKDSNNLIVNERKPGYCENIVLCSNYTSNSECDIDECGVAEISAPKDVDCDYLNCSCAWNTATEKCDFWVTSEGEGNGGLGGGTCEYKQETTDDCADGYLTYNFIANWTGLPEDKPSWCKDSTQTVKCPLRAQLPFFSTSNILIAIALIVLIYIILTRKKSSRKKRK